MLIHLPIHAEFACVPGNVTINDLPDELIISIARFIAPDINCDPLLASQTHVNNGTLLKLALCSQRFRSIVEPVLYERFHDDWGSGGCLDGFMVRLLTQPDLGRRVKFIHWQKILSYTFPVTSFGEEGWKAARNQIMGLHENPAERDAWDETVEEVGLEAIVGLLFVLTPNLEELVLRSCDPIGPRPPVLKWMSAVIRRLQLQRQLENPAALWKLRSVNVSMWATGGMDLNHVMELITIPSVEIFWGWALHETVLRDFLQANNFVLDNIKELDLTFDHVDPDILKQFLCRFPSLKRLSCSIHEPDDLESYPPDLVLVPHSLESQLEYLAISDYAIPMTGGILIHRKLKSLASFKNLRTLRTDWPQLVGQTDIVGDLADTLFGQDVPETSRHMADVIPTSLERLTLRGDCASAPAVIFELLKQKHRFPNLKYLDLEWLCILYPDKLIPEDPHIHRLFSKAESLECLSMCRDAGVEIVMQTQPPECKHISYPAKDEQGNVTGEMVDYLIEYPYDDYDKICIENGCDLATGRLPD